MLDHIAVRRSDVQANDAPPNFTTSYRASAACTRELGRLYEEIATALAAWRADHLATNPALVPEAPVVRRSPARCLVQLGPVALTVAWLQRAQGTVAARTPQGFERTHDRAGASSATPIWERVLVAVAEREAHWGWAPVGSAGDAISSATLAAQCVQRLCAAYEESNA